MGLSIHYQGRFGSQASLAEMIEEVKDIAEIYHWQYTIYEQQFPSNKFDTDCYNENIFGISFTPPESESICLCFLSNGRMSSIANLKCFGNSTREDYQKYLYMISTKTQFAGSAVHKLIIHLLKYINEKYLQEFELIDEGHYWETGDEKLLHETFKEYDSLLDSVEDAVKNVPKIPDESFEDYFRRVLDLINKRNNP